MSKVLLGKLNCMQIHIGLDLRSLLLFLYLAIYFTALENKIHVFVKKNTKYVTSVGTE